jgi:hypothetical protein
VAFGGHHYTNFKHQLQLAADNNPHFLPAIKAGANPTEDGLQTAQRALGLKPLLIVDLLLLSDLSLAPVVCDSGWARDTWLGAVGRT